MARKSMEKRAVSAGYVGGRILSMADARSFGKSAKATTAAALRSKSSARKLLIESGILTPTGRLAQRYRTPKA